MGLLVRRHFGKRVTISKRRKTVIERAFAAVDMDWLVTVTQAELSGCYDDLTSTFGDFGIRRTARNLSDA